MYEIFKKFNIFKVLLHISESTKTQNSNYKQNLNFARMLYVEFSLQNKTYFKNQNCNLFLYQVIKIKINTIYGC